MTSTASKTQSVARTCACGTCAVEVLSRNSLYAPGHDARHAGLVAREVARTGDVRLLNQLPTAALHNKADRMATALMAKPSKSAKRTSPTVEGTVKVGRWVYPATRLGPVVNYNTKRDGSGTIAVADAKVAATFRAA